MTMITASRSSGSGSSCGGYCCGGDNYDDNDEEEEEEEDDDFDEGGDAYGDFDMLEGAEVSLALTLASPSPTDLTGCPHPSPDRLLPRSPSPSASHPRRTASRRTTRWRTTAPT